MVQFNDFAEQVKLFGADKAEEKNEHVMVFVPSKTRDGRELDHTFWRNEAVRIMSTLFGGATSVPGFGGWLDEKDGGKVKEEAISVVCSFISEDEWHLDNALEVKNFLYRMGREAEQGAVAFHARGRYMEIPSESYEEKN